MSVLPAYGGSGLKPGGSWEQVVCCTARVVLLMVASCAVFVGALLLVARCIQTKTLRKLQGLPQFREHFPYQTQWILMRACDQPMSPVGFSVLIFAAVRGFHAIFQNCGWFLMFFGFRPVLTVYKAEFVEEVLSSNKILTKGPQYTLLHSWLGTGLLTSGGDKWRSRRRLITPAFHFRILDDFMGTINAQSFLLVSKLETTSCRNKIFNVLPLVTRCALDTICETIMGTNISAQSNENTPYVVAVSRLGQIFLERVFRPLLLLDIIFRLTPLGREYAKCVDTVHSFTRKVIAERKEKLRKEIDNRLVKLTENESSINVGHKTPRPLMDLLLLEHFKGNITEDGIREEVDTFMFAGHDTTATGISWALFLIGHHPVEQKRIHDELDSIFGDDMNCYVTSEDLKRMKYLECAIKESQRIYPSIPVIARTCSEPFTIGQKFVLAEEKIVLANILRRFKVKSLDQRDQVELVAEIVLRPRSGLRIHFAPR